MSVNISIRCSACGSKQFLHPENLERDSPTTCIGCGLVSTFGELYDRAAKDAFEAAEKDLRDFLR